MLATSRFARQDLAFLRRQRLRRVAALVLQQMPQILVGRDAEQLAARLEAGRELEVGEIGAAVAAAQPVLLLGEIVVADAGAMQLAQRLLGGTEIGDVAVRLGQMQRHAVDEAAHQRLLAGPQQFRPDVQVARQRQRAAFASEQMTRRHVGPPRHLVEPAQHRVDLAGIGCESGRARRSKTRRASAARLRSIAPTALRRRLSADS